MSLIKDLDKLARKHNLIVFSYSQDGSNLVNGSPTVSVTLVSPSKSEYEKREAVRKAK